MHILMGSFSFAPLRRTAPFYIKRRRFAPGFGFAFHVEHRIRSDGLSMYRPENFTASPAFHGKHLASHLGHFQVLATKPPRRRALSKAGEPMQNGSAATNRKL